MSAWWPARTTTAAIRARIAKGCRLYAGELTREGVFEALRARRTFAVTGDRIALDFRINGR